MRDEERQRDAERLKKREEEKKKKPLVVEEVRVEPPPPPPPVVQQLVPIQSKYNFIYVICRIGGN